tara:strand:+ start:110 stop:340 length:231 start_codon:yes stop_codon:yes gene_type:complete
MITAFFTGVIVAIPTSLVTMKLLNSSLFINNQELSHINEKISILINQLDDYREERLADKLGIEEGNIKLETTDYAN